MPTILSIRWLPIALKIKIILNSWLAKGLPDLVLTYIFQPCLVLHLSSPLTLFSIHPEQTLIFTYTPLALFSKPLTGTLCLLILLSLPEGVSWDITFSWKPPWVMGGGNFSWIMAPAHHKNFVTDSLNVTPDYFLFDTFLVFPRSEIMFRFSLIFLIGDLSSSLGNHHSLRWGVTDVVERMLT